MGYGPLRLCARQYHEDLCNRGPACLANMKASRKGTRLNDAFYFRQPLPHPRRIMTAMCLMPQLSNMQINRHFVPESLQPDPNSSVGSKPREQSKKLDVRQSSIEMARIPWNTDWIQGQDETWSNDHFHSTYVETDKESLSEIEGKVLADIADEDANMADVRSAPEAEEVVRVIERVESLEKGNADGFKEDVLAEDDEKDTQRKRFSWWKEINVGQAIYQLFSHLFARRHAPSGRQRTKKAATKRKRHVFVNENANRVIKVSKVDRRRYPCDVNDVCRPIEELREDESVSMFVRQIEQTRDKNLRVTLLEKELRTRICALETHKNGFRCETGERRAARQISSPLC